MAWMKNAAKGAAIGTMAGMLAIATPNAKVREGLSLIPYKDIGGVWTNCYGETLGINRNTPKQTEPQCSTQLTARLMFFGKAVDYLVKNDMTNERWAGLTDFTYNVGISNFSKSTLLKKINTNDRYACAEILKWVYTNSPKKGDKYDLADNKLDGKMKCDLVANRSKCGGIISRREYEYQLCTSNGGLNGSP